MTSQPPLRPVEEIISEIVRICFDDRYPLEKQWGWKVIHDDLIEKFSEVLTLEREARLKAEKMVDDLEAHIVKRAMQDNPGVTEQATRAILSAKGIIR